MTAPLFAIDIMTRDVATVTARTSVTEAVKLMVDRHISGLPVVDAAGAVVGILTEGDLLRRVELGTDVHRTKWLEFVLGPGRLAAEYVETHSRTVGDIMTREVATVTEITPLRDVVALMERKHIKRVPVVADGVLAGVVSRSDLLRALSDAFSRSEAAAGTLRPASDVALRDAVLAELRHQSWSENVGISVIVSDGVVGLEGVLLQEPDRAAIRVAVENVPGVKAVHDRLQWLEPYSGMTFPAPPPG